MYQLAKFNCGQAYFRFRRWSQTRNQGITSGSHAPTTNLDTLARNLQNVKDKHVDQPSKKRADNPLNPHVASVELPWLDTTRFQKCMHVQDVLYNGVKRSV